jgi:hypothetical protein
MSEDRGQTTDENKEFYDFYGFYDSNDLSNVL